MASPKENPEQAAPIPQNPAENNDGDPSSKRERQDSAEQNASLLTEDPELKLWKELNKELKFVESESLKARSKIKSLFDDKKMDMPGNSFTPKDMKAILTYPVYQIEENWQNEVRELFSHAMPSEDQRTALKEKYGTADYEFTDSNSPGDTHDKNLPLIPEAIDMVHLYLTKITEKTEALTPEVLAEMRDSASKRAEIFSNLLHSGKNRDLVRALQNVLAPDSDKSLAVSIIQQRLDKDFPNAEILPVIMMMMAFLPEKVAVDIAKNYKQKHPDQIIAFLEEANKMGAFTPEQMEEVMGYNFEPEKRERYALSWKAQNDFHKQAELMTKEGKINYANKWLSGAGAVSGLLSAASWGTIIGNTVVTGFVYFKDKSLMEAVESIPAAVKSVALDHNVLGATAILATKRYLQKHEAKPLARSPKEAQGLSYLRLAKNANPFWDRWNKFFTINSFEGGKVFADYVGKMKKRTDDQSLPEKQITMQDFLDFVKREAKSKNKRHADLDYSRLEKNIKGYLFETGKDEVVTLAKAFSNIDFTQDNYQSYLDETRNS